MQQNEKQVLPLLLAEAGFDVWLANSRCNQISMAHVTLNPNDDAFWNWYKSSHFIRPTMLLTPRFRSWDEMARFDLPATIKVPCKQVVLIHLSLISLFKLVLQQSGARTLSYIGHSQGTATGWAAFSQDYEGISSRINLFVSLAPVVYLKSSPSILFNALAHLHVDTILQLLGSKSFLPSNTLIDKIIPGFCTIFPKSCQLVVCILAGCEQGNMDAPTTAYVTSHFPAPTATKNMVKWAQSIRSGQVRHTSD